MIQFKDAPDILTVDQVADLLHVERTTIKRYIKKGLIKAKYLTSNTIRILKSDIEFLFKGAK